METILGCFQFLFWCHFCRAKYFPCIYLYVGLVASFIHTYRAKVGYDVCDVRPTCFQCHTILFIFGTRLMKTLWKWSPHFHFKLKQFLKFLNVVRRYWVNLILSWPFLRLWDSGVLVLGRSYVTLKSNICKGKSIYFINGNFDYQECK